MTQFSPVSNVTVPSDNPLFKSDFNGDGNSDIIVRTPATGENSVWYLSSGDFLFTEGFSSEFNGDWIAISTGDLDGDNSGDGTGDDLVWYNVATGDVFLWYTDYNGSLQVTGGDLVTGDPNTDPSLGWTLQGVGDFDKDDQKDDLVWFNETTRSVYIWYLEDGVVQSGNDATAGAAIGAGWELAGSTDYEVGGGAPDDLLWRNTLTGEVAIWIMEDGLPLQFVALPDAPDLDWDIKGVSDFDNDQFMDDILWQNTITGSVAIWNMGGNTIDSITTVGTVASGQEVLV